MRVLRALKFRLLHEVPSPSRYAGPSLSQRERENKSST